MIEGNHTLALEINNQGPASISIDGVDCGGLVTELNLTLRTNEIPSAEIDLALTDGLVEQDVEIDYSWLEDQQLELLQELLDEEQHRRNLEGNNP